MITLFDFSTPVALTPGDWFISAVNVSGGPVGYTMMATEFAAYGTNVVITSCQALTNSFCLTWTSVPGIHYYVQGKTNVNDTNWVTVSPTIVATDVLTTWCIALPSPCHFFRVSEGLVVTPYVPPLRITSITLGTNGVLLQWLAPTNSQFQAQWTPSLAPPAWTSFTNILTSTNGVLLVPRRRLPIRRPRRTALLSAAAVAIEPVLIIQTCARPRARKPPKCPGRARRRRERRVQTVFQTRRPFRRACRRSPCAT